jgi:hypothetical protein
MRRLNWFVALLALLLLVVPAVTAQDSGWQVIAISREDDAQELLTITSEGISERTALPAEFPASFDQIALSPDRDVIATIPRGANSVTLMDISTGDCCTDWSFTDEPVFLATLAGFSPDGSQLAISYVVENPMRSFMLLMDVATGNIDVLIDMTTGSDSDPNYVTYPFLTGWDADGIRLYTSCVYCVESPTADAVSLWEPVSGAVTPIEEFADFSGDRLPSNGATLRSVFALDYPSGADAEAIFWGAMEFGVENAVVLKGPSAENGEAIVYDNAEHTRLISRWVAGGNAFIVFFTNDITGSGELVLPNGERQPTDFAFGHFLSATPDGWLTRQNGQLAHYRLQGSTVTRTSLGELTAALKVLQQPQATETAATFTTDAPPEAVTCPGFMESRLLAGHLGRVLPGPANNMRAEPTTTSPIIAKIAGAEPFAILEGPVCAQGLAWWRVAFNNTEGWTAEGSGLNYWVEQAPQNGYRAPTPEQ